MPAPDWIVVGGGIPALVSAFYLQQRGARVLVVDDNNPSASRAGAGILSPLPPWSASPAVQTLTADGAAAYPRLLAALGDDCDHRVAGMLVLPPFDAAAVAAAADWQRRGGVASSVAPAAAFPALAALPDSAAPAALLLPSVAVLHPRRLIKALRRHLPRRVATVAQLAVSRDGIAAVQLDNGERLPAARVLLSAGAWSGRLCPPPAPAITPVRGQMVLFDNPGNSGNPSIELPHILLQPRDSFYLLQRRDGRLLAGSTLEQAGYDESVTTDGVQRLVQRAAALLPALRGRQPRTAWAGLRPAADAPVIARHERVHNLYLNSGHYRYGVTMAPAAAARLLEIAGEE